MNFFGWLRKARQVSKQRQASVDTQLAMDDLRDGFAPLNPLRGFRVEDPDDMELDRDEEDGPLW